MRVVMLACVALMAAPALAQDHQGHSSTAPACHAVDAALPAGLEDWKGVATLKTVTKAADLAQAEVALGKGHKAELAGVTTIFLPVQPEKPGGSTSYGGLFRFTVPTEGSYTVALGSAAWIDVVKDGKSLEAVSFVHGPECTTIRKMVTFALKPGMHILQVSGAGEPSIRLIVAKQP